MSENNGRKLRETMRQIHDEWQKKGVRFPEPTKTVPLTKTTKKSEGFSSFPQTTSKEGVGAILLTGSLPKKGSERLSVSGKTRKILTDSNTFKKENS